MSSGVGGGPDQYHFSGVGGGANQQPLGLGGDTQVDFSLPGIGGPTQGQQAAEYGITYNQGHAYSGTADPSGMGTAVPPIYPMGYSQTSGPSAPVDLGLDAFKGMSDEHRGAYIATQAQGTAAAFPANGSGGRTDPQPLAHSVALLAHTQATMQREHDLRMIATVKGVSGGPIDMKKALLKDEGDKLVSSRQGVAIAPGAKRQLINRMIAGLRVEYIPISKKTATEILLRRLYELHPLNVQVSGAGATMKTDATLDAASKKHLPLDNDHGPDFVPNGPQLRQFL
jgi:hypothetical protein